MHTQVFCTSCPGMFQWSLSRVLMWVEEKGKNLAENESQGMRWSRGVDGRYLRKREERVCKVYLTEFIGDQRKVWRDDMMVTTGLTKDKKRWLGFSLPGYLIFLSALRNERQKKGALSRFYVAFWKQNKPSTEQYIQPQNFSDMSALIFSTSQVLPVKHPVWYPLRSLFSLVDIP